MLIQVAIEDPESKAAKIMSLLLSHCQNGNLDNIFYAKKVD